jgi:iron complex outermembrane recepter protein
MTSDLVHTDCRIRTSGRRCVGQQPLRSAVAAAVVVAVIGVGRSAYAVDATSDPTQVDSTDRLEEITVTAERREESLQKAPIPVSVLTAKDLDNAAVNSQNDLTRLIPDVNVYQGGGNSTQASLRGVGNLSGNTYAEQAIAFSLDGSYIARGEAVSGNFYDLDRLEVLKGPQGTLYGRNTNAGAINIITQKPIIGEFGGNVEASFGNFDKYSVEGAVNLPTSDESAIRLAGQRVYHSGYLSDGYDDQDESDGRISWLWKPTQDVSLRITGNYSDLRGKGAAGVLTSGQNGNFIGPSAPSQQAYWSAANLNPVQSNGHNDIVDKGINAQLDWVTEIGTVTLLSNYLAFSETSLNYGAGFPLNFDQGSDTRSVEIRLASPTNQALTWILGGYYFKENADFDLEANQTSFIALDEIPGIGTRSLAGFGQGTLKLQDDFRVIFGARYTKEDKSTNGQIASGFTPGFAPPAMFLPPCVLFTPGNPACFTPLSNSLSENRITWKAGLEYDLTAYSMLYGTVSTGFKAGGFYADPNATFKPETLTAYTLGAKNRFLDNRLQFNLEAYYWLYKNKQVSILGPLPTSGNLDLLTVNAGNAKLYGLEPDVVFLVTPQDEVSATAAYEHASYETFLYTTVAPGPTGSGVCPTTPNGVAATGQPLVAVNCSGFQVPNAPKWRLTAAYSHTFNLSNSGTLVGIVSGQYRSSDISGEEQTASEHLGGYATEDATLTYNHPGHHLSIAAYVDNLANKESYGSSFFLGSFPTIINGPVGPVGPVTLVNPPRTYGLRANVTF